jgi:hypothetical protein
MLITIKYLETRELVLIVEKLGKEGRRKIRTTANAKHCLRCSEFNHSKNCKTIYKNTFKNRIMKHPQFF